MSAPAGFDMWWRKFGGFQHDASREDLARMAWAAAAPEPPAAAPEVEERVIQQIRQRRDVGRAKYGVSMERGDLSLVDWLRHAQEEAMDLAIYLEKAIAMAEQERKR